MEFSCQSSINIIDIKVGLQNLVFKYHCSLKINQGFLETWLILDLGQERYNKHLEHLDILEKKLSKLHGSYNKDLGTNLSQLLYCTEM